MLKSGGKIEKEWDSFYYLHGITQIIQNVIISSLSYSSHNEYYKK